MDDVHIELPPRLSPEERRELYLRFFQCTHCKISLKGVSVDKIVHCKQCETARFCCSSCKRDARATHRCRPIQPEFKGMANHIGRLYPDVLAALQTLNKRKRADGMPPFRDEHVADMLEDLFISSHELSYHGTIKAPRGYMSFLDPVVQRVLVPPYMEALGRHGVLKRILSDIVDYTIDPVQRAKEENALPPNVYFAKALVPILHAQLKATMHEALDKNFPKHGPERHRGMHEIMDVFHQTTILFQSLNDIAFDTLTDDEVEQELRARLKVGHPGLFEPSSVKVEELDEDEFFHARMAQWSSILFGPPITPRGSRYRPPPENPSWWNLLEYLPRVWTAIKRLFTSKNFWAGLAIVIVLISIFFVFMYLLVHGTHETNREQAARNAVDIQNVIQEGGVAIVTDHDRFRFTYESSRAEIKHALYQQVQSFDWSKMANMTIDVPRRTIAGAYSILSGRLTSPIRGTYLHEDLSDVRYSGGTITSQYGVTPGILIDQFTQQQILNLVQNPAHEFYRQENPAMMHEILIGMGIQGFGATLTVLGSAAYQCLTGGLDGISDESMMQAAQILVPRLQKRIDIQYEILDQRPKNKPTFYPRITVPNLLEFIKVHRHDLESELFLSGGVDYDKILNRDVIEKEFWDEEANIRQGIISSSDLVCGEILLGKIQSGPLTVAMKHLETAYRHVRRRRGEVMTFKEEHRSLLRKAKNLVVVASVLQLPLAALALSYVDQTSFLSALNVMTYWPTVIFLGVEVGKHTAAKMGYAVMEHPTELFNVAQKWFMGKLLVTLIAPLIKVVYRTGQWGLSKFKNPETSHERQARLRHEEEWRLFGQSLKAYFRLVPLSLLSVGFAFYYKLSLPEIISVTDVSTALPLLLAHGTNVPGAVAHTVIKTVANTFGETKLLPAVQPSVVKPIPSKPTVEDGETELRRLSAEAVESNRAFEQILLDMNPNMGEEIDALRLSVSNLVAHLQEYAITGEDDLLPDDSCLNMPPAFVQFADAMGNMGQALGQTDLYRRKDDDTHDLLQQVGVQQAELIVDNEGTVGVPLFAGKHGRRPKKHTVPRVTPLNATLLTVSATLMNIQGALAYVNFPIMKALNAYGNFLYAVDAWYTGRDRRVNNTVPVFVPENNTFTNNDAIFVPDELAPFIDRMTKAPQANRGNLMKIFIEKVMHLITKDSDKEFHALGKNYAENDKTVFGKIAETIGEDGLLSEKIKKALEDALASVDPRQKSVELYQKLVETYRGSPSTSSTSNQTPAETKSQWDHASELLVGLPTLLAENMPDEAPLMIVTVFATLANFGPVRRYVKSTRIGQWTTAQMPEGVIGELIEPTVKYIGPLVLRLVYRAFYNQTLLADSAMDAFLLVNGLVETAERLARWRIGSGWAQRREGAIDTHIYEFDQWAHTAAGILNTGKQWAPLMTTLALLSMDAAENISLWKWGLTRVTVIGTSTFLLSVLMEQARRRGYIQSGDPPGRGPAGRLPNKTTAWHLAWATPAFFAFYVTPAKPNVTQQISTAMSTLPWGRIHDGSIAILGFVEIVKTLIVELVVDLATTKREAVVNTTLNLLGQLVVIAPMVKEQVTRSVLESSQLQESRELVRASLLAIEHAIPTLRDAIVSFITQSLGPALVVVTKGVALGFLLSFIIVQGVRHGASVKDQIARFMRFLTIPAVAQFFKREVLRDDDDDKED